MAISYKNNKFYLLLNPVFLTDMEHWTLENIIDIVRHEGYHILMGHLEIYKDGNQEIWNKAMDCEINQYLTDLPKEGYFLETLIKEIKLSKSEVQAKAGSIYYYDLLAKHSKENKNNSNQNNNSSGNNDEDNQNNNSSSNDDSPSNENNQNNNSSNQNNSNKDRIDSHEHWGNSNVKKEDSSYIPVKEAAKQLINQAEQDFKHVERGNVSNNISALIEKLNKPAQIKWQKLLKKTMGTQVYGKKETIHRLNRRQPSALHKKGKKNDTIAPIVVAFDCSGSISVKDLSFFYNEVREIATKFKFPVEVLLFDSQIKDRFLVTNKKDIKYTGEGFGGTSFQPIFDLLNEEKYPHETMLFIFTDGYGESSINTYSYKKYNWIITNDDTLSVSNNTNPIIKIKTTG